MENIKIDDLIGFNPSDDHPYPDSLFDISDIPSKEDPISITTCLRLHKGDVKVHGTIASISKLYKMVKSITLECSSCSFVQKIKYPIPIDPPQNFSNVQCSRCGEKHQETSIDIGYVNAVKIDIQDSESFSDIEKLSCILFDKYTIDIQIGSKVIVAGSIQIIKQKSKRSVPCLYASSIHYESKEKLDLTDKDIDAIRRLKRLKNGSLMDALTKMFAPSVIGLDIIKKGLLLSAVSSSEDLPLDGNRDRIHVLLVGPPGCGKSKLIRESVKLVPNSRYESSQHASGKSLTAIVSKEDDDYCLRTGPVPMARGVSVFLMRLEQ